MINIYDDIRARLEKGLLWDFPGGVFPPQQKELSNQQAIDTLPLPEQVHVPLKQHVGVQGQCLVALGDKVLKGQPLTHSSNPYAVPVHAPTSGTVSAIEERPVAHPSGLSELCVTIIPDGLETWQYLPQFRDYQQHSPETLVGAICDAGISGLGGAGFPTHIKAGSSKPVEFLIINGIECEPYITSDDRLMREHAWQIRQGIDILNYLVSPKTIVVAIEDNKPEAIDAMKTACQGQANILVVAVPTKYPAGGEKQLIQVLTGREVPRDRLPIDAGTLMFNVGTCYAIADALLHGKPLVQRVVTLTGQALGTPGNVWALIGTPVIHLLRQAQYQPAQQRQPQVIMGGPMMGFTLADANIPVVKITNCVLVPADQELTQSQHEQACIRCSACADACPASLLPQQLYWHSKANEYDKAQQYNLFDCIECGACAYVCPSEIPLVHYYRQAKATIRLERDEKNKAEKAKQRFEARKERLEREKEEREARHKRAAEARLKANQESAGASNEDRVAAALARAKARKAENQATTESPSASEATSDKVAAAIARAKAKKAAQQAEPSTTPANKAPADTPQDVKKAQVAAAIARAKAKKAAQQAPDVTSVDETASNNDEDAKKAKVAAAVARAKAKRAAQASQGDDSAAQSTENVDDKQARVAAAVAKAKAKRAAQAAQAQESETQPTAPATSDKQAKVAAAVAKAKARQQAKKQQENKPE